MSVTGARLEELGLALPDGPPPGAPGPLFSWVVVRGDRAFVAGHGPGEPGRLFPPFGQVGVDVAPQEARRLAFAAGLCILGSLERALGDLDRIAGWSRVFGMVNAAPGYQTPHEVIDGCSELILAVFGPDRGAHARTAIGVSALPFDMAVEIEAEVLLHG